MRRIAVIFSLLVVLLVLASCGASTPSQSTASTSGLTFRVYVTNATTGSVWLVDAKLDRVSLQHPVLSVGMAAPGSMSLSQDKKQTLVLGNGAPHLTVISNLSESTGTSVTLSGVSESAVFSADDATAYAAVRNAPVFGQPPGAVQAVPVSSSGISATIPVPDAHYVTITPDGRRLLVLSDTLNTATIIYTSLVDTPSQATQPISLPFDRPVAALFSSDGNTAYIVNCGAECGGTQASVSVVDISPLPGNPVLLGNVPVPAATVVMLDGTTLYVAGTSPTVNSCSSGSATVCGRLTPITLAGLTAGTPVEITDGYHDRLGLGSNNLLFAGAINCTNLIDATSMLPTRGCLAIYDIQKQTVSVAVANGDVTGIQPIRGRNMVYVAQGGELVIYDTTTGQPIDSTKQIDVVGQVFDVKLID